MKNSIFIQNIKQTFCGGFYNCSERKKKKNTSGFNSSVALYDLLFLLNHRKLTNKQKNISKKKLLLKWLKYIFYFKYWLWRRLNESYSHNLLPRGNINIFGNCTTRKNSGQIYVAAAWVIYLVLPSVIWFLCCLVFSTGCLHTT